MTNTTVGPSTADIPNFPMARARRCPFDPAPGLRALQGQARIARIRLWDGSTPWLVTGYADQRNLLTDPRVSADGTHPNYPHPSAGQAETRKKMTTFLTMDDPDHGRLRRMVTAPFAIKRVEALRPTIQGIADDLIDRVLKIGRAHV